MRRSVMIFTSLILLSNSVALAVKLKVVSDLYKESESLRSIAQKESPLKFEKIKDLEKSFKSALDQYEKENPKAGDKAEQEVSLLFYTLEPVFKLANSKEIKTSDCLKVRQEVKTGDSMGRPEGSLASKQADEAYKWLDILCPEDVGKDTVEKDPTAN
ncbi:hypothetical protein [Bdellovibrio svalbardensis]|uniref:Uncharacterized protein n=1 Tax=Bdellovibrio svalbardensis TaxID=2972972 RepID=A0ABT6DQW9_9BACT|nr:hypothetical protein [Bdellovibrio svalbardensis]MDG0818221.1 hypothetical protein [Bdellovibrio svalbardensis]